MCVVLRGCARIIIHINGHIIIIRILCVNDIKLLSLVYIINAPYFRSDTVRVWVC